jgi:hypothetical protein
MAAPPAPGATVATDLEEYYAVMDSTTKLSQRRESTNDILTGINIIFLTAMGAAFVVGHLTSWWLTAIFGLITAFAWLFDITWIRLLNRYKRLIGLRISYLEALEAALRRAGAFVDLDVLPEKATQPIKTRGVYTLEHAALYGPGSHGGFIRRERFLVILFILAYLFLTAGVATLTQLIALHVLPSVSL